MKFIAKYGIGLYLIISLMFKLSFLIPHAFVNILFQILMGLGLLLFFFFSKLLLINKYRKAFGLLYFAVILNLLYLIFMQYNVESFTYFLAKFSTANLIAFGLISNYAFYKKIFISYFKYIIAIVLLVGYFFGGSPESSAELQRLSIGFNPNDVGLFGAIGALSILLFNPTWYKSKVDILLFSVFLLLTLLSGSKAALLNLLVGSIFIYGFSPKILGLVVSLFLVYLITPNFGNITSIDRLMDKEGAFETRDKVFEIGLQTIKDKVYTGHGIDKYGWTDPKYWPVGDSALGPHNSYLSIVIMYGVVFGFVYILSLFLILIKSIKTRLKVEDIFVRFCALIIILSFINGFFETLIVAVNEFITVLFWFAVGVIGYYKIDFKRKIV